MAGCDVVNACENAIEYDEKKQTVDLHEGIKAENWKK